VVDKIAGENKAVRGNGHFEQIGYKRCALFGRQKGRTSPRFLLKATPHSLVIPQKKPDMVKWKSLNFSQKNINSVKKHKLNIKGAIKMTKPIHPEALFRIQVLGSLTSRADLEKGELNRLVKGLSKHAYETPNGKRIFLSPKTIERWYYLWKKGGIDGLAPKERHDRGKTQIAQNIQSCLLELKEAQPSRSINTLIRQLEVQELVGSKELSRSSVHRFLKNHGLSKQVANDSHHIERRAFEALHAGDIWYSDVLHGPYLTTPGGQRKTYLITFLDDASRLACHSGFYFTEGSLALEHAFKEALLKRGMPRKLIVDNGSAYRAGSLQTICARLEIHLIHCRPYEPQGKGKLERWHRTLRAQFLDEINVENMKDLNELNTHLWVWLEHEYHQRQHEGLEKEETPLSRWRKDQHQMRELGVFASQLDSYFYHRIKRKVRKDAVVSWNGNEYEVPFQFSGEEIYLVVDPHKQTALIVESMSYETLGSVFPLDRKANCQRRRQRPTINTSNKAGKKLPGRKFVEDLVGKMQDTFDITNTTLDRE
jgi:putative transposase